MRVIRRIIDHMNATLDEAEEYYDDYVIYKDEYPKMANVSLDMASTHLNLYNRWHDIVTSTIADYKIKSGEPTSVMKELWDYEHRNLTEEYDELAYKVNSARR